MMKPNTALSEEHLISFLTELYEGDLHAKRVLSLAHGTLGVLTSASVAVHAIGQGLAHARGTLDKHGVKQVDRLLSNAGIDLDETFGYWVGHVMGARREVVVALDWTSFARDGHETLMLSMLTGHGRATPLMWKTVRGSELKDRTREYERELLSRFAAATPSGVAVTVVADRGFADCKLLKYIHEELRFDYVCRFSGSYYVFDHNGQCRLGSQWVGANGRARTLRGARLTKDHRMAVGTVVCVRDARMKDSWCLAASSPDALPKVLVRYYAKRWGIETSFRDLKDPRYGLGLLSVRIRRPDRRDRLMFLSALAIALLSLLGAAGEHIGYDRWLKANTSRKRSHSLFRQGRMLYEHIPNWPEQRLRPLLEQFASLFTHHRALQEIFGVL